MKKKLFIFALVSVLAMSSLAGCGEENEAREEKTGRGRREEHIIEEEVGPPEDEQVTDLFGTGSEDRDERQEGKRDSEWTYDTLFGESFPDKIDAVEYKLRMNMSISADGESLQMYNESENIKGQEVAYECTIESMHYPEGTTDFVTETYWDLNLGKKYEKETVDGSAGSWEISDEAYRDNSDASFASTEERLFNQKVDMSLVEQRDNVNGCLVFTSNAGNVLSGECIDMLSGAAEIFGTANIEDTPVILFFREDNMEIAKIEFSLPTGETSFSGQTVQIDQFDLTIEFGFNGNVIVPVIPEEARGNCCGSASGDSGVDVPINPPIEAHEIWDWTACIDGQFISIPATKEDFEKLGFMEEKDPQFSTIISFEDPGSNCFITASSYDEGEGYSTVYFESYDGDAYYDHSIEYAGVTLGYSDMAKVVEHFGHPQYEYKSDSYYNVEYHNGLQVIGFASTYKDEAGRYIVTSIELRK